MKYLLLSLALGSILVVSCSSTQQSADYKTSESASERLARRISSDDEDARMESVYQEILADAEPEKRLESFFSRLVRIYFRTDKLVKAYDARLEEFYQNKEQHNARDIIGDRAYVRLMAAWIVNNRQIDKISYIYKRNYMEVVGRKDDPTYAQADKERDLKIKRALMAIIKKYGDKERLAMQNLLTHLGQVALEAHNELKGEGAPADAASFEGQTFSSAAEQTRYFMRKHKLSPLAKDQAANQEIDEEIQSLEGDVSAHLNEVQGREPQAAGDVIADAGPKGNLTGNTFKAGRWALTYDDGPSAKHTPNILTNLETRGLKTSFFWLANATPNFPTLINRAKTLEMALGNHSFSHANLPKQGAASLNKEIVQSTQIHTRMFGFKPTYFRCPYGACGGGGSNIRQMIAREGMVHIFWNIDSLDWQDKNPASIVNRVKKAMAVAKKGIILFHDIHPQSVEATKMLMDEWLPSLRTGSMRLLTIPQAITELNSDAGMQ